MRAARLTALDGKRVAVAEEYRVGGTCVIRGCVPKKFMVMASEVSHALEIAEGLAAFPQETMLADRAAGKPLESTYNVVDTLGQMHSEPWGEARVHQHGAPLGVDQPGAANQMSRSSATSAPAPWAARSHCTAARRVCRGSCCSAA